MLVLYFGGDERCSRMDNDEDDTFEASIEESDANALENDKDDTFEAGIEESNACSCYTG